MPAKINGLIPQQRYEIIGDRIAEILTLELYQQGLFFSPQETLITKVFRERFIPIDVSEYPCINVILSGGPYDNKDIKQADGTYKYYIAAYVAGKTNGSDSGDTRAALKLQRLLGICRGILENPVYKTLDFTPQQANIKTLNVGAIALPATEYNQDATMSVSGYLEFNVKVVEDVLLKDGVPLGSSYTEVKLYDTETGYYYQYEAP